MRTSATSSANGGRRGRARRQLLALVLAATIVAIAWPIQDPGWSQKAHYALVRSLADGTARIDAYHWDTGDKSYWKGHFYSVKAPGLAFVTLPAYLPLRELGLVPAGDRTAIWLLGLIVVAPLAVALLFLTRRLQRRLSDSTSWLPAFLAVAGTMVLPFAGLYYSHVPTAALAAVSVLLALRARERRAPRAALAAGLVAGASVLFEYPMAVLAVILAAFLALTAHGRARTVAAFCVGMAAGVAPLALYNWWAFGSPSHLSYVNAVVVTGDTGHDVVGAHAKGIFGITWPSIRAITELLLSDRGLLVTSPAVAAGVAGLVLLAREGRRREAALLLGTGLAALLYNGGLTTTFGGPFGGDSPGPRYLVPVLPLLLAGLVGMMRRAPGVVAGVGLASVSFQALITATRPQVGPDESGEWYASFADGAFTQTPLTLAGLGSGWIAITPFFAALAIAAAAVCRLDGVRLRGADTGSLGMALVAWAVVAAGTPRVLDGTVGISDALLALVVLAAACASTAFVVSFAESARRSGRQPGDAPRPSEPSEGKPIRSRTK